MIVKDYFFSWYFNWEYSLKIRYHCTALQDLTFRWKIKYDREGYIDKVVTNMKLHCHDCDNCLVINILTKHWSDVLSSLSYMLNWLTVMDIDWMPPSGSGAVLCLVLLEVDNNNKQQLQKFTGYEFVPIDHEFVPS